jgi:hypothetical protein
VTEINQLHDDLRFVRDVVTRGDPPARGPAGIYLLWAVYVLVGYTLIDVQPRASGWFFLVAGVLGGIGSWFIGRRVARREGAYDRREARRALLHWGAGIVLAIACAMALGAVMPALRGQAVGQLVVVMIGLVYFLAGVHFDPNFLWLGPVLMVGGIVVGFVPHYGWTALGAVIALGLVVPTLLPSRRAAGRAQAGLPPTGVS